MCLCIWVYSLLYLFCNFQEYSLCRVTIFACSALCIWKAIQPISHLMRGRCLETSSVKIGVQRFLGKDHDVGICNTTFCLNFNWCTYVSFKVCLCPLGVILHVPECAWIQWTFSATELVCAKWMSLHQIVGRMGKIICWRPIHMDQLSSFSDHHHYICTQTTQHCLSPLM